jgi:RluA family pseudouridine synthase
MALDILYLDNHLLVINKAPGMLAQGDQTGDETVLTLGKAYLKAYFNKPGRVFLGLVHRLDRPASGIMVLARTSKAARRLTDQFRRREPVKRYMAIVEGSCKSEEHCLDYLVKENRTVRVVDSGYPGAKRAVLQWRTVAHREGMSLVDVNLETGRSHQIRVQLAHRGHPILGDFRYGARRPFDGRNLALHGYFLSVTHPTRREMMHWYAHPGDDWDTYFEAEIRDLLAAVRG